MKYRETHTKGKNMPGHVIISSVTNCHHAGAMCPCLAKQETIAQHACGFFQREFVLFGVTAHIRGLGHKGQIHLFRHAAYKLSLKVRFGAQLVIEMCYDDIQVGNLPRQVEQAQAVWSAGDTDDGNIVGWQMIGDIAIVHHPSGDIIT